MGEVDERSRWQKLMGEVDGLEGSKASGGR